MQTFEAVVEAGADRILHVDIPVKGSASRYHVIVVLREDAPENGTAAFPQKWPDQFFESTAGAWQGNLERVEQGVLGEREEF